VDAPHLFLSTPWGLPLALSNQPNPLEQSAATCDHAPYPRFVLTENDTFVYTVGASVPLPSRKVNHNGGSLRITELPGPAIDGDKAHKDTLEVRMNDGAISYIQINYRVPDASGDANTGEREFASEILFDQVLDEMIFITRNVLKVDRSRVEAVFWQDVLETLKREYDRDPAKHALVAELAESIVPSLERIAGAPKKALRRIRDQERIQSVRELDKNCLIDLARRPGASLPEKAGPRQRVLSIKRHENVNTLENQVYLHCCEMLALSSKRYLSVHSGIEGSNRKRLVETLSRCCHRLTQTPLFNDVSRLRSPCRLPNYVLLQNIHYAKIWRAYSQLLRNEQLRDFLWRWSRRLCSDYLAIYLSDTITHWFKSIRAPIAVSIGEKVVQAQTRPEHGSWLLTDIMPGPLVLGTSDDRTGTLYAIDGASCKTLGSFAAPLDLLNADFLLVWLTSDEQSVLPVYVNICDHSKEPADVISQTAADLLNEVAAFNNACQDWRCVGGWVFHDLQDASGTTAANRETGSRIKCWQSCLKTGTSTWNDRETDRFAPLSELTGLGLDGTRN